MVGDIVGKVLGDLGLDGVARAHQIGAIWEEAVGPRVAVHCRPIGLRGEVLELEFDMLRLHLGEAQAAALQDQLQELEGADGR